MIDMQDISILVDLARTMEEERVTLRRAQLCLDWNIARHAPCFSMPGNNATPTCARGDEPSATWARGDEPLQSRSGSARGDEPTNHEVAEAKRLQLLRVYGREEDHEVLNGDASCRGIPNRLVDRTAWQMLLNCPACPDAPQIGQMCDPDCPHCLIYMSWRLYSKTWVRFPTLLDDTPRSPHMRFPNVIRCIKDWECGRCNNLVDPSDDFLCVWQSVPGHIDRIAPHVIQAMSHRRCHEDDVIVLDSIIEADRWANSHSHRWSNRYWAGDSFWHLTPIEYV